MTPTIRLKSKAPSRLKELFGLTTDSAVAERIGLDQGQYSRILNGRSSPGPYVQARLLLAVKSFELGFDDFFEIDEGEVGE